jgi:hypothetical protein
MIMSAATGISTTHASSSPKILSLLESFGLHPFSHVLKPAKLLEVAPVAPRKLKRRPPKARRLLRSGNARQRTRS